MACYPDWDEEKDEDVVKGVFEWKIGDFLELRGSADSPEFRLGGYDWNLYINQLEQEDFVNEKIRPVDRYINEIDLDDFSYQDVYHIGLCKRFPPIILTRKILYELSVINRFGQFFLSTCGTIYRDDNDTIIMVLCRNSLKRQSYEALPGNTLTLRLSWTVQDEGTPYHIPEKVQNKILKTLSDDFSRFYTSKTDTDCVLRVGDVGLPVHRGVLSARSNIFADMFHHDTSENRSNVVDIPDVDAAIMSNILNYIYSGQIIGLTSHTAIPMYIVADKYALMDMKNVCLDVFRSSLTIENVCSFAIVAYTHEKTELTDQVVGFVEERLGELEESENWKRFVKYKPSLAIKILYSVIARKDHKILNSNN